MTELRRQFIQEATFDAWRDSEPRVLVTAVRLPSGAIETAENRENLYEKIQYIVGAYDDEFRLKANPAVQIVGYMLV